VTGHGVVLAEAHGSFAQSVTDSRMTGEARRKYLRQVKPHITSTCMHGRVIHGYAVAFGSNPTSRDTFLHVAETKVTQPRNALKLPEAPSDLSRAEPRAYVACTCRAPGKFPAYGRIEHCRLDRLATRRRRTT
jgi:hypothetical protein